MGRFDKIPAPMPEIPIDKNLAVNKGIIENLTGKSADIILHEFDAVGVKMLGFMCDGMCDSFIVSESILKPVKNCKEKIYGDVLEAVKSRMVTETDFKDISTINEAVEAAMGGFFVLFAEGADTAISFSVQGFSTRSVDEPVSEAQEKGAREGFVENFKINMTMIRRRMRSADVRFKLKTVGATGKNQVCLCFIDGRVSEELLANVEKRIDSAEFDNVLESGYLQPFLDTDRPSLFSGVGVTERPDVMCAKMSEGKVGIIVDGTPFALYVPHVFVENLHSLDDYSNRPFYTTFIRLLKIVSFIISIILPGLYVGIAIFHQELFPEDLLYSIVSAELRTPFPIMLEALIIHLIFEIMREAGLRMPKTVGHAVSIVGALVIGDAAVTAGLIAAPMLIVVALTAISSFVIPSIYNSVAVLRLTFIIIGGTMGIYGIFLGLIVLAINMTAINPYGVPYTSPFAPLIFPAMRDVVYRQGWKRMSKKLQVNRTLQMNKTLEKEPLDD